MHRFHALLAIATLLALLATSIVPVSARPASLADMGLQAVGAAAGQWAGSLIGMVISLPSALSVISSCEDVPTPESASGSQEVFQALFSCAIKATVPLMTLGSNLGMGAGLGTLAGLVITAQLQGRDGSVLGAIAGVFVGQALMTYVITDQISPMTERLAASIDSEEESPPDLDERELAAVQWLTAFATVVPVILGVLGYNLL